MLRPGPSGHTLTAFGRVCLRLVVPALLLALPHTLACTRAADTTTPPAMLAEGWEHFRFNDFKTAMSTFSRARAAIPPDDPLHAEALFAIAATFNHRRPGADFKHAEILYNQIVTEYPETDAAAWSLLAIARMRHLEMWDPDSAGRDRSHVGEAYQRVIDRYPKHPAGEEAVLYQQANALASRDKDQAAEAALRIGRFVADHPESQLVPWAYHLLSMCHDVMDDPGGWMRAKGLAVEHTEYDPTTAMEVSMALYTWLVAVTAEFEVGDFDMARAFYKKYLDEYPTHDNAYAARRALTRMDETEARIRAEVEAEMAANPGGAP
jgi:outer membrane protein assembly factor BamD (BamD/ComL family)